MPAYLQEKAGMLHFKKLLVWQKGMEIAVRTFQFTQDFPAVYRFNLASQIQRAGTSIPANIAEGSSRRSEKDHFRFLEIALGSCFELESHLLLTKAIGLGNTEARSQILLLIDEEQKMLFSLKNKLKN